MSNDATTLNSVARQNRLVQRLNRSGRFLVRFVNRADRRMSLNLSVAQTRRASVLAMSILRPGRALTFPFFCSADASALRRV